MRLPALLLILLLALSAAAQSTQDALRDRLIGKPLYLRCLCANDKLLFDATGKLIGPVDPISFTMSGIEITAIDLGHGSLALKGRRVGLHFDRNGTVDRVPIKVRASAFRTRDEDIRIDIAAPQGNDYGPALDAVFTENTDDLAPYLPAIWRMYAAKHMHGPPVPVTHGEEPNKTNPEQPARTPGTRKIGGGVTPPVVQYQPEPAFSEQARATRISGNVLVYLHVEKDGLPSHISIVRPCGMGLDEKAVEAVSRYRFLPATSNGEPVPVEMNVEVNFQIF